MSFELTGRFIEEFNYLDDVLKDMYPNDVPSKLGVTRYLEDMKTKELLGLYRVQNWAKDYERLKSLRNLRNDAIHKNLLGANLFDDEDICWIIDFKRRIFSRQDPLSLLRNTFAVQKTAACAKESEPHTEKSKNGSTAKFILALYFLFAIGFVFFLLKVLDVL